MRQETRDERQEETRDKTCLPARQGQEETRDKKRQVTRDKRQEETSDLSPVTRHLSHPVKGIDSSSTTQNDKREKCCHPE